MDFTLEQKKAIAIIKNYLNVVDNPTWTTEYIMDNYDFVVDQIIENSNAIKNLKPSAGILQARESNQSVTFKEGVEAWTITSDIASMLPKPFVKLFY
ncbi:hypothetical protein [Clostridium saccharoperbutylacetonicum]|uniref:hypothetical protein n=1 Tax=Clostridium saccharoperbutylacetonicum TaxID=36745 RepID=UPI0039EAFAB9